VRIVAMAAEAGRIERIVMVRLCVVGCCGAPTWDESGVMAG